LKLFIFISDYIRTWNPTTIKQQYHETFVRIIYRTNNYGFSHIVMRDPKKTGGSGFLPLWVIWDNEGNEYCPLVITEPETWIWKGNFLYWKRCKIHRLMRLWPHKASDWWGADVGWIRQTQRGCIHTYEKLSWLVSESRTESYNRPSYSAFTPFQWRSKASVDRSGRAGSVYCLMEGSFGFSEGTASCHGGLRAHERTCGRWSRRMECPACPCGHCDQTMGTAKSNRHRFKPLAISHNLWWAQGARQWYKHYSQLPFLWTFLPHSLPGGLDRP